MPERKIISVSQLNRYIKSLLDSDLNLNMLFVRGELSNYKMYPSGHHYFTLKDEEGSLRCVLFKREASSLAFRPENGMKVIARGRVTVFPRDGQYQLYCVELIPDGAGELHVAFEQLKEKLREEGLFEPEHKKPLPPFPERIALITSPAGAAVRDMLRILKARFPLAKVLLLPVRVQGAEAPGEISAALRYANRFRVADLIITGRGGGSLEDLWAFNDEAVARAIFESEIPVISAVGHEPDVTIADYVADLRAATPSNAAELAVPDRAELMKHLDGQKQRIARILKQSLLYHRTRFQRCAESRSLSDPLWYIQDRRQLVDIARDRMLRCAESLFGSRRRRFVELAAALDALSPLKVLGRGYSIVYAGQERVVKSWKDVAPGEGIRVRLKEGTLLGTVDACIPEERMGEQGEN